MCVLIAALLDDRPPCIRGSILELLYQILDGAAVDVAEIKDLMACCRNAASEGIWLLIREFAYGFREPALEVLKLIDTEIDYESLV